MLGTLLLTTVLFAVLRASIAPIVQDVTAGNGGVGVVTGTIVDESGAPVVQAHVRALRPQYLPGVRRLTARGSVQTNALGHFRLDGLPPGRYVISAAVPSTESDSHTPKRSRKLAQAAIGFAPTFYPGTTNVADAQPVIVRAGEEVQGVTFALQSVRLARVTGVAVDSSGRPAAGCVVTLIPAWDHAALVSPAAAVVVSMTQVAQDGGFTIANVQPGEYRLTLQSEGALNEVARSGRSGLPQTGVIPEYASVRLDVDGTDIDGLTIVTSSGHRLAGQVSVEGADAGAEQFERMTVSTFDLEPSHAISAVMFAARGRVRGDGSFEVRGVTGKRIVQVAGLPSGWALKSVRLFGTDVTDEGIAIAGADVIGIEVVVTAKPAQLTGTVTDALGRPAPNLAVIVFSDDSSRWQTPLTRHVSSARVGANGSFKVTPLPAGAYRVAVVDALVDGEWAEPENLEALRRSAVKVTLAESELKTLTLKHH